LIFDRDALAALREVCAGDPLRYEMLRNLLDVERRYAGMAARRGLFDDLANVIDRCAFEDAEDALRYAKDRRQVSDQDDETQMPAVSGVREDENGKISMSLMQLGSPEE